MSVLIAPVARREHVPTHTHAHEVASSVPAAAAAIAAPRVVLVRTAAAAATSVDFPISTSGAVFSSLASAAGGAGHGDEAAWTTDDTCRLDVISSAQGQDHSGQGRVEVRWFRHHADGSMPRMILEDGTEMQTTDTEDASGAVASSLRSTALCLTAACAASPAVAPFRASLYHLSADDVGAELIGVAFVRSAASAADAAKSSSALPRRDSIELLGFARTGSVFPAPTLLALVSERLKLRPECRIPVIPAAANGPAASSSAAKGQAQAILLTLEKIKHRVGSKTVSKRVFSSALNVRADPGNNLGLSLAFDASTPALRFTCASRLERDAAVCTIRCWSSMRREALYAQEQLQAAMEQQKSIAAAQAHLDPAAMTARMAAMNQRQGAPAASAPLPLSPLSVSVSSPTAQQLLGGTAGAALSSESPAVAADSNAAEDQLLRAIDHSIVGKYHFVRTPFGTRRLTYVDWTASGKSLHLVEELLMREVMPTFANTHTGTSASGLRTTTFREEARALIKSACNGTDKDVLLFAGSGSTGAIKLCVHLLDIVSRARSLLASGVLQPGQPALEVWVGPYEHHSNLLPWREIGRQLSHEAIAGIQTPLPASIVQIHTVAEDEAAGGVDLRDLQRSLQESAEKHHASTIRIGSFSAASNITGLLTDTHAVARMLHRFGALSLWDYAGAAPYGVIDQNPEQGDPAAAKDAIFISPHKFVGGPGTPGLLLIKKRLCVNAIPSTPGGGTVLYVTQGATRYLQSIEEREEGGTPEILGAVRAGLVFQLKGQVGLRCIARKEHEYAQLALRRLHAHRNIVVVGHGSAPRVCIFSFLVQFAPCTIKQSMEHDKEAQRLADTLKQGAAHDGHAPAPASASVPASSLLPGQQFLHPVFLATLLNDLFGIHCRAGCMCAGPYAVRLLGVEDDRFISQVESALVDGVSVLKPGFIRFNLNWFVSRAEVDYVLDAVLFIAEHAWRFLPLYTYTLAGEWRHSMRTLPAPGEDAHWDSPLVIDQQRANKQAILERQSLTSVDFRDEARWQRRRGPDADDDLAALDPSLKLDPLAGSPRVGKGVSLAAVAESSAQTYHSYLTAANDALRSLTHPSTLAQLAESRRKRKERIREERRQTAQQQAEPVAASSTSAFRSVHGNGGGLTIPASSASASSASASASSSPSASSLSFVPVSHSKLPAAYSHLKWFVSPAEAFQFMQITSAPGIDDSDPECARLREHAAKEIQAASESKGKPFHMLRPKRYQ